MGILKRVFSPVLVFGILLIVIGVMTIASNNKPAIDFENMSVNDLKVGQIVEGDLPYNLGCFAKGHKTRLSRIIMPHHEDYYYAIFVEDCIIAIKAENKTKLNKDLELQSEETVKKMFVGIQPVSFRGKINKMDDELHRALSNNCYKDGKKVFETRAYVIEPIQSMIPYYIFIFFGIVFIILHIRFIMFPKTKKVSDEKACTDDTHNSIRYNVNQQAINDTFFYEHNIVAGNDNSISQQETMNGTSFSENNVMTNDNDTRQQEEFDFYTTPHYVRENSRNKTSDG